MSQTSLGRTARSAAADDPWRAGAFETSQPCPVCGEPLRPGRGWVFRYHGRWVRLRCGDCVAEFERDPARYLAEPPPS